MNKVINETKEPTPQVSSCHEMTVAERDSFCTAPLLWPYGTETDVSLCVCVANSQVFFFFW